MESEAGQRAVEGENRQKEIQEKVDHPEVL
jgi:hypothetical protein